LIVISESTKEGILSMRYINLCEANRKPST
jgi:hypothetical protein